MDILVCTKCNFFSFRIFFLLAYIDRFDNLNPIERRLVAMYILTCMLTTYDSVKERLYVNVTHLGDISHI